MKPKEKEFCRLMAAGFSPREAAAHAGYHLHPRKSGLTLVAREDIRGEIRRCKEEQAVNDVMAGLRRIAFGSVTDAVALALRDTPPTPEELETMDLFSVSEIKRPKGGGLEVKFYDRLKALEQLKEEVADTANEALPFYKALQEGARRLKEVQP